MPLGASRFGLLGGVDAGALTLIETQTASSSFLDFESLADYDTYLFTFDQITVSTQTEIGYRVERSGSYQASSYEFANQRNQQGGSTERRNDSQATVRLGGDINTSSTDFLGGYLWLTGANNSSIYTFTTHHVSFLNSGAGTSEFGSGCHSTAGTVTGIRFGEGIFSALDSGVISQYGLEES